jgi:hypothetical protein
MNRPPQPTPGLNIELPEDLQPVYSNTARISHTPFDFVLDFTRVLPAEARVRVLARVIMSPISAKLFLRALTENLVRYETTFGEIILPKGDSGLAEDLFRKSQPPEPPKSSG